MPHVYGSHASTFVCLFCSVLCFVCSGGWGRENFILICLCHQAASIIFVVFLQGRVVEIYGPEASGKTTLALHVIAEAQKQGGYS